MHDSMRFWPLFKGPRRRHSGCMTKESKASASQSLNHTCILAAISLALGCTATTHPVTRSPLGSARSTADLEAVIDQPGTLTARTINAADWGVDLSGLLNLDNPKAKAAKIGDRVEPIAIYFHEIVHPVRGLYLIDSGVERALRDDPSKSAASWMVRHVMHLERLKVHEDMATYLGHTKQPLRGVFLTHLHLDHVSGLPDVPSDVPIYVGPGDVEHSQFLNLFVRSTMNSELEGKGPLREFTFQPDPSARFRGVLDVFGDGQLWALFVPGHTQGSIAYVARTPDGPILFTGDASHTAWGWQNDVEPGSFSEDKPTSALSLHALRELAARHPKLRVRLGHQAL